MTPEPAAREAMADSTVIAPAPPRQSGVDRFDESVATTPVRSLVALGACLLLAAGVVTWASLASIERTITAVAVSVSGGGFARIVTPTAGVVAAPPAQAGQSVTAGDEVAQITRPDGTVATLVAPVSGRVLNSPAVRGTSVDAGDPVVTIENTGAAKELRMFLRPLDSERVAVGTRAIIRFPGRADLAGRVTAVSLLPLTFDQVETSLGSAALARVVAPTEPVVSVTVIPDAGSSLPEITEQSEGGRVATASLIVGRTHPIDYVL